MAGERQPLAIRTFDCFKKFTQEATGIDAGRQATKNNKLVDIEDGKVRLDIKGSTVFLAHNLAPIATRTAQHPKLGKYNIIDVGVVADFLVTGSTFISAGALAASLKVDTTEAIGIIYGINTAKNAAIVLVPDAIHAIPSVLHSIGNVGRNVDKKLLSPHFKHRPNLSNNGAK